MSLEKKLIMFSAKLEREKMIQGGGFLKEDVEYQWNVLWLGHYNSKFAMKKSEKIYSEKIKGLFTYLAASIFTLKLVQNKYFFLF